MAETNQGIFFNPQTENVVGQAYNDLVFSQQERITEEKEAAKLAATAETAKATAASKADKERLELLKEQAKAAQKDADARKKEVSTAIRNIDVVPNAMYNAYASPLRDAAKYLADNMDQLIEQYGVDKVRTWTEQLNNAGDELKATFNPTFKAANALAADGELGTKISGAPGYVESFTQADYDSAMAQLNNTGRFKINFQDGWAVQDAEGNDISFSDWVKAGVTEPKELFQSRPQMAFSKNVVEAWGKFRSVPRTLNTEANMDTWIENELRMEDSTHRLTALNEYYNSQDPETAMPYDELFSQSNAGAERIDEAVQNYKDRWMELYREAVKKEEKTSGGTSRSPERGRQFIDRTRINPSGSDITKQSLASLFTGIDTPISEEEIKQMGIKGVAVIPRELEVILPGTDQRNKDLFGVEEGNIRISSLAFSPEGQLFVGYEGMLTPEAAASAPNDELLRELGIVGDTGPEAEMGLSSKVVEFGTQPWIDIVTNVGSKKVGSSYTLRESIEKAFPQLDNDTEIDFYAGLMILANSTNDVFFDKMIGEIVGAGGVTRAELEEIAAQVNQ